MNAQKQNRITATPSLQDYAARLRTFISESTKAFRAGRLQPDAATQTQFNDLALALFRLQHDCCQPYQRLCQARGALPKTVSHWSEIPSVPAAAFKEFDLTAIPENDRTTVFYSSGTTAQQHSRHFHNAESLSIYELSLLPWFERHLLPERMNGGACVGPGPGANGAQTSDGEGKMRFVCLAPHPSVASHSSLVHMFGAVAREFGASDSVFTGRLDDSGAWALDIDATVNVLRQAEASNRPVMLLGAAFSFARLLDSLADKKPAVSLPAGSRAMETGGYKGRTRSMSKLVLHELISTRLGIPASHIVGEYGMCELSSQAYDRAAGATHNAQASQIDLRLFRFPPWARARIISPETGRETDDGKPGLITVVDLANVWSVTAVQTEDLGIRRGNGFELLGRAALAEPRGCSIMLE